MGSIFYFEIQRWISVWVCLNTQMKIFWYKLTDEIELKKNWGFLALKSTVYHFKILYYIKIQELSEIFEVLSLAYLLPETMLKIENCALTTPLKHFTNRLCLFVESLFQDLIFFNCAKKFSSYNTKCRTLVL